MKGILASLVLLLVAEGLFSLSGCSGILNPVSKGNEKITDESIVRQIEPDVTTMQEVRASLGTPDHITQASSADTKWFYGNGWATLNKTKSTALEITFRDNVVIELSYGESQAVDFGEWNTPTPTAKVSDNF